MSINQRYYPAVLWLLLLLPVTGLTQTSDMDSSAFPKDTGKASFAFYGGTGIGYGWRYRQKAGQLYWYDDDNQAHPFTIPHYNQDICLPVLTGGFRIHYKRSGWGFTYAYIRYGGRGELDDLFLDLKFHKLSLEYAYALTKHIHSPSVIFRLGSFSYREYDRWGAVYYPMGHKILQLPVQLDLAANFSTKSKCKHFIFIEPSFSYSHFFSTLIKYPDGFPGGPRMNNNFISFNVTVGFLLKTR